MYYEQNEILGLGDMSKNWNLGLESGYSGLHYLWKSSVSADKCWWYCSIL